jgi:hypothetical protein
MTIAWRDAQIGVIRLEKMTFIAEEDITGHLDKNRALIREEAVRGRVGDLLYSLQGRLRQCRYVEHLIDVPQNSLGDDSSGTVDGMGAAL